MSVWLFGRSKNQKTLCYCPICKNELIGSNSFVSDTKQGVTYKCTKCGCKSLWWFDDIVPWIIKYQHLEAKMTVSDLLKTSQETTTTASRRRKSNV